MEYPKAFKCLTRVQFHSNQGRSNELDERVQGKFLKGSFLGSKMDSFFGDGIGGLPCKSVCFAFHATGLDAVQRLEQKKSTETLVAT